MSLNPMQEKLEELKRQQQENAAQTEDIARQLKAALRREEDLQQQMKATQTRMAKLGLMQIGQKVMLRAELDNIRKKQDSNRQMREALLTRQNACRAEQASLSAQLEQLSAAAQEQAAPAVEEAPAVAQEPLPVEKAPVAVPAKPAVPRPRSRTAPTRKPAVKPAALSAEDQKVQFFQRLEALYPEHQVFALDSISPELGKQLQALAAGSGSAGTAEFLAEQGWQLVDIAQAKKLRQGQFCTPGEEPEAIRARLNSVLRRLEKHYPDRCILRSIQHDHKSLAQDVSGLYQWLGYPGAAEMLKAYGFRYEVPAGGRPATDTAAVLDALQTAYASGDKPHTITQIMNDHPEFAGVLKTLQNQSPVRFGMPLRQYLTQIGILAGSANTGK